MFPIVPWLYKAQCPGRSAQKPSLVCSVQKPLFCSCISISVTLYLFVMSTPGEGDRPAVDLPVEESKPVTKEKKPKVPKEKKPKQAKTVSHPPYFQMIKEALLALNEKAGSSPYAIAKYMEEKHKSVLPANFRKILALQLKNQATRGKLVKIKASYKLSSEAGKRDREIIGKVTRSSTAQQTQRSKRSVAKKTETGKKPRKAARKMVGMKKTKKSSNPAKPKQLKSLDLHPRGPGMLLPQLLEVSGRSRGRTCQ
ncbi:LOW QUALITY PROTEIN: histone H1 [Prosopis cineraria]|uniref:LOW QUALITY PROTEIN: histone H1 n=1 Tax=Prosopis cineraria TaxID=364024 RepID=UPI00241017B0|nr:LOW QUALITY PROTEIN: histone H1 [Prosopis cineraria]